MGEILELGRGVVVEFGQDDLLTDGVVGVEQRAVRLFTLGPDAVTAAFDDLSGSFRSQVQEIFRTQADRFPVKLLRVILRGEVVIGMIDPPGPLEQGRAALQGQGRPFGDPGDIRFLREIPDGEVQVFHDLEHHISARIAGSAKVFRIVRSDDVVIKGNIAEMPDLQEVAQSPEEAGLRLVMQPDRLVLAVGRMLQEKVDPADGAPSPVCLTGIGGCDQAGSEHPRRHVVRHTVVGAPQARSGRNRQVAGIAAVEPELAFRFGGKECVRVDIVNRQARKTVVDFFARDENERERCNDPYLFHTGIHIRRLW